MPPHFFLRFSESTGQPHVCNNMSFIFHLVGSSVCSPSFRAPDEGNLRMCFMMIIITADGAERPPC